MKSCLLVCAVLMTACLDEGGDDHQTLAATATAEGLLAFADLSDNLTTDPGKAADALLKFLGTPIAARELVSPPFQFASEPTVERLAPADLPGCVTTTGPAGCDSFAATECVAGNFEFTGSGSRMCPGCPDNPDTLGACTYSWNLDVGYSDERFDLKLQETSGTETVSPTEITANVTFPYRLSVDRLANSFTAGLIEVCACGPLTIDQGPPRKLVRGEFVVKDRVGSVIDLFKPAQRCAQVTFNDDVPTSILQCSCSDGVTCRD
jgi:hypothetical protein